MAGGRDVKGAVSLAVSSIAAVISLGGVAYAAGSLATRVEATETALDRLQAVPERLARIEADLTYLRQAEERRQNRGDEQ